MSQISLVSATHAPFRKLCLFLEPFINVLFAICQLLVQIYQKSWKFDVDDTSTKLGQSPFYPRRALLGKVSKVNFLGFFRESGPKLTNGSKTYRFLKKPPTGYPHEEPFVVPHAVCVVRHYFSVHRGLKCTIYIRPTAGSLGLHFLVSEVPLYRLSHKQGHARP